MCSSLRLSPTDFPEALAALSIRQELSRKVTQSSPLAQPASNAPASSSSRKEASTMSTVLPPPSKRQKTVAAAKAREPINTTEEPIPDAQQRIQFLDADTGAPASDPVFVQLSQLSPKNLSLLLNTLLGHTNPDDRLPYRFYNPYGDGSGEFSQEEVIKKYLDGTATTGKSSDTAIWGFCGDYMRQSERVWIRDTRGETNHVSQNWL